MSRTGVGGGDRTSDSQEGEARLEPPVVAERPEADVPDAPVEGFMSSAKFRFVIRHDDVTEDQFCRKPTLGYLGGEDGVFRLLAESLGKKHAVFRTGQATEVDYVLASAEALVSEGIGASELAGWIRGNSAERKFFLLTGGPGYEGVDCREFVFDVSEGVHGARVIRVDGSMAGTLERLIRLDRSVALSDFSIRAAVSDGVLSSEVTLGDSLAGLGGSVSYQFKVMRGSEVVHDSGRTGSPAMELPLKKQGVYLVRGFVACGGCNFARRSNSVCFYRRETMGLVDRILSEPPFYCQAPTHVRSSPPFQDILVHVSRDGRDMGGAACREGMSLQWRGMSEGAEVSLYSESAEHLDAKVLAVSGYDGASGSCFVRAEAGGDRIDLTRDACAFGQLFVYESAGDTVIANHYYTLLRALSAAGVPLRVNDSKIELTLSVVRAMVMQQNNYTRMDIEGISQVPPDRSVSVVAGRVVRVCSPVGEVLDGKVPLTYPQYMAMLDKASREITEAVAAAAAENGQLRFDLTGGLDSRLLFAALTNTDVPKEDIGIFTWGGPDSEDVRIALEMNSLYGYGYGDSTIARTKDDFAVNDNYWRNKLMGRIYSTSRAAVHNIETLAKVSGGVGGGFGRPEYCRRLFWTAAEYAKDPRGIADRVWQDQVSMHVVTDSATAEETFLSLMSEEIANTPGASLMERFGLNYLFFRNAYHFNPETYYDHGERWIYPLQNLTVFELNHRTHDVFASYRLEIELINHLNPVLSPMRTSNKWGEEDYRNLEDLLENPHLKCYDVSPNTEGLGKKREDRNRSMYSMAVKPRREGSPELELAVLLNRIRILSRLDGGRYHRVAESLLLALAADLGDKTAVNSIYNRVSSAVDQIHLAEGSDGGLLLLDAYDLYVPEPKEAVDELKLLGDALSGPGATRRAPDLLGYR